MTNSIIIIQRWWRSLPGCRKCGSKNLAWRYTCHQCYYEKHHWNRKRIW